MQKRWMQTGTLDQDGCRTGMQVRARYANRRNGSAHNDNRMTTRLHAARRVCERRSPAWRVLEKIACAAQIVPVHRPD